jgi:hypothetical protein
MRLTRVFCPPREYLSKKELPSQRLYGVTIDTSNELNLEFIFPLSLCYSLLKLAVQSSKTSLF